MCLQSFRSTARNVPEQLRKTCSVYNLAGLLNQSQQLVLLLWNRFSWLLPLTSAYFCPLIFLQLSSQCFTVRTTFAGNEQCLVTYCILLVLLEDFKFSHTFIVAYPQLGKLWAGCHIFDSVSQFFSVTVMWSRWPPLCSPQQSRSKS